MKCVVIALKYFLVFLCLGVTNNFEVNDVCSNLKCSNVLDAVCGLVESETTDIKQVPDNICKINANDKVYTSTSRRVNDFSVVGSFQSCNHSCPTYCVDTYDPVCAKIYTRSMESYDLKPMVNHCHVDLFSCVVGVNVTINSISACFKNPAGLLFMSHMAGMKTLKLLDENSTEI